MVPSASKQCSGAGRGLPVEDLLMNFIDLIVAHGYSIVLAVAFVDQFGTPIPSIAILLAAGAVAGLGQLSLAGVLFAAWLGTVAGGAAGSS